MSRHHLTAEKHLNDAVSLLLQARESAENAKRRNASARAIHEAALAAHQAGHAMTVARDAEADELLQGLAAIGLAE